MKSFVGPRTLLAFLLIAVASFSAPASAAPLTFEVTYDAKVTDAFTGRVYVMFATGENAEPRRGPSWMNTQPFFALDVEDWAPGEPLVFDDAALSFPGPLSTLTKGEYAIQAVMRRNLDSPSVGTGEGTAFSGATTRTVGGADGGRIKLHIARVERARRYATPAGIEIVKIRSTLLSDFYGRDQHLEAAVWLPDDLEDGERVPTFYAIPGFGGDHMGALRFVSFARSTEAGKRFAWIALNPRCWSGHHVFADSANNGPVGQALIDELIPHLEATFPLVPASEGRFVTGASSGGWSSLWLQIQYPKTFGGVWSLCPDPVDFTDFQRIDLYADNANMYRDYNGERRPIGRFGGKPAMWYDEFARMEHVMGWGGQLFSFEAVFSPRVDDWPRPLYDRETGDVDPVTAEAWKQYDIRRIVEVHWDRLAPQLAGKMHIYTGEEDNFYLEGAVRRLKRIVQRLGGDWVIEIQPGHDHSSVVMANLDRITKEAWALWREKAPTPTGSAAGR